jgi:Autotransporter beta-domain
MLSGGRAEYSAAIRSNLACGVRAKRPILGAGILVLMLFSASAAQAQCTAAGPLASSPSAPKVATAVAGVSASVGALVSSIYSANTAFLNQSNAFIGSPDNPQPDQQGGGVWARGVGGHLSASATATAGNLGFGGPLPGTITCNTRALEDFAGVQLGADIARLNVSGWNLHAGSTIGYLGSKTQDATPAAPGLNPAPSFHDSLRIPFVGVYGAASYGGLLVDGQIRGIFFQNEVSDDNLGLSGQHFDARGISLTGNVAYNQELGNHWFVAPSAGIVWSRTHVDPLNVPAAGVVGTSFAPGFVVPSVLTTNDLESTLGRLTVRVGTTVASGSVVWQPFVSASVIHEFQGGATSSLSGNFAAMGSSLANLSTSSFGIFGQFGVGVAAKVASTGWVSYLRGDYRRGDYIEGWSVNGGLRYQFAPDPLVGGGK